MAGGSCGSCEFCSRGQENLCDAAAYTGYQTNGGFAEYCVADHRFCFPIPTGYPDLQAAPLLCAGLIGYRSLNMTGDARRFGALVPAALRAVRKGGVVVCAGIHMSDIPSFPYALLWGERSIRSVANLTRGDGEAFMALAPRVPVKTETNSYPLERANQALEDLREGRFDGAAVIVVDPAAGAAPA
jgi:D-arabinose 1-dehydrogenase-like Zn-dependent alcohol dehydrogenase